MLLGSALAAAALLLLAAAPGAASAADCPHSGDLVTALSAPDRRAALLCAIDAERAARGLPVVQRERAARARGAGPLRRHGRAALLRPRHPRRLDARRPRRGHRLHRRAAATGSSARRSPGPSSRSTRPTASCARGWPAPATARSSSTARFRDVGIGVTPGLTDGCADPGATAVLDFGFRTASPTLPRWRSATSCARTASTSRQRRARCASTSTRSKRSTPANLRARSPAPLPGGSSCRRRRLPPSPRRDQLRLGLVPDAAQAGGLLGLLHRRVVARRPLARRRGVDHRAAARDELRRGGRDPRPAPRPRAHGPLRPGPARARALPRRAPRARRRRAGARIGAAPGRAAGRGHDDVAGPSASTSARRSPPATSRWAASPSSATSTR